MKAINLISVFLLVIKISMSFSQQGLSGSLYFLERKNKPIKKAEIIVKNLQDSITERSFSNNDGTFYVTTNKKSINYILIFHPVLDTVIIYERNKIPFIFRDSILFYELSIFDYTITKRGSAIIYEDIETFLNFKNSNILDLAGKKMEIIPYLRKIKKHGVRALFLEKNNLTTLPKKIFTIKGLSYLDLSENPLDDKSKILIEKFLSKKDDVIIIY